jgi:hypothetical protein
MTNANVAADLDEGVVNDLLDRLYALEVTARWRGGRLMFRGKPGFEHDTAVQALIARLRWHHAAYPEEVLGLVRQREQR